MSIVERYQMKRDEVPTCWLKIEEEEGEVS
jgi:hypothetical protein